MMLHGARALLGEDAAAIKLECSAWAPSEVWGKLDGLDPKQDLLPQLEALGEDARQLLASIWGHVLGELERTSTQCCAVAWACCLLPLLGPLWLGRAIKQLHRWCLSTSVVWWPVEPGVGVSSSCVKESHPWG